MFLQTTESLIKNINPQLKNGRKKSLHLLVVTVACAVKASVVVALNVARIYIVIRMNFVIFFETKNYFVTPRL